MTCVSVLYSSLASSSGLSPICLNQVRFLLKLVCIIDAVGLLDQSITSLVDLNKCPGFSIEARPDLRSPAVPDHNADPPSLYILVITALYDD